MVTSVQFFYYIFDTNSCSYTNFHKKPLFSIKKLLFQTVNIKSVIFIINPFAFFLMKSKHNLHFLLKFNTIHGALSIRFQFFVCTLVQNWQKIFLEDYRRIFQAIIELQHLIFWWLLFAWHLTVCFVMYQLKLAFLSAGVVSFLQRFCDNVAVEF